MKRTKLSEIEYCYEETKKILLDDMNESLIIESDFDLIYVFTSNLVSLVCQIFLWALSNKVYDFLEALNT